MFNILFEDKNLIVLIKPVGVSSEDGMVAAIREHLGNADAYVGIIHRLDTAVSGVMVYAKTKIAAADLSRQIQDGVFIKKYLAVVSGSPEKNNGRYEDLLFKDSSKNKSFVVKRERKGVKKAVLDYETLSKTTLDNGEISLLKIRLHTGRTHQIRVQFSHRKMCLLGDKKYGSRFDCPIALFSHSLTFTHPEAEEEMCFTALPEKTFPFNKFEI
ncbi:MAG: RluA family pseudouridine synthase [Ruminococcaceae bacterium]|nr:RluA family pseudouridine synthase [Oscillospiraceae bacterium]